MVQNMNNSVYVTISSPPFQRGQGAKKLPPESGGITAYQIYNGNALVPQNRDYLIKFLFFVNEKSLSTGFCAGREGFCVS